MPVNLEIRQRREAVARLDPLEVVSKYFFGGEPYAFRGNTKEYNRFCEELESRLKVSTKNITLIGSGRLGFSLNKARLFCLFRQESDLDVAVVSSAIFDRTWIDLVRNKKKFILTGESEMRRFKRTRENIFEGYFRPDHLPLATALSKNWFPKLSERFDSPVAQQHSVLAWLFKSWDHARYFYAGYVASIQTEARKLLDIK